MYDKERLRITENTAEVLESLTKALDDAGGNLPTKQLLNMSMMEFISHVCVPNGVRFTCVETKPVDEPKVKEFYYDTEDEFFDVVDNVTCTRCGVSQSPYHIYDNPKWRFYCRNCFALFGKRE
jgi:hypothetical protein